MHSLPLFHRIAGERVVVVGLGGMAAAKARLVERAGGIVCAETEAHHAKLAFVALEEARAAEAAALRLKRLGLLVNVADRPELCDFTLPSILDRESVLVAISTGGASAGLAKHLRLRLEGLIPQSIGGLASGLSAMRDKLRARWPDADMRRSALDRALEEGGPLDVLQAESASQIDAWIEDRTAADELSIFEFILTSDDPDELTLRQARLLGRADTVLHDPAIPEAILVRARADAQRRPLPGDEPTNGLTVVLRRSI